MCAANHRFLNASYDDYVLKISFTRQVNSLIGGVFSFHTIQKHSGLKLEPDHVNATVSLSRLYLRIHMRDKARLQAQEQRSRIQSVNIEKLTILFHFSLTTALGHKITICYSQTSLY